MTQYLKMNNPKDGTAIHVYSRLCGADGGDIENDVLKTSIVNYLQKIEFGNIEEVDKVFELLNKPYPPQKETA